MAEYDDDDMARAFRIGYQTGFMAVFCMVLLAVIFGLSAMQFGLLHVSFSVAP